MIYLLSLPNCQPCKAVKRLLDGLGVTYKEVDASSDLGTVMMTARRVRTVPVLVAENGDWVQGFNPNKIKELVNVHP